MLFRSPSSASSVTVENFDMDHVHRMSSLAVTGQASRESSRPSSPRFDPADKFHSDPTLPKTTCLSKERPVDQLSQNMERIFTRFADMQQCLAEIRDFTQNGKKAQGGYPNACEPPYVNVTCQVGACLHMWVLSVDTVG